MNTLDLLERYRFIKNKVMFLYSSEDTVLDNYIRDYRRELNAMSGEFCDIYVSEMQNSGNEFVYSFLTDLKYIPGISSVKYDSLPVILLWSETSYLSIKLNNKSSDFDYLKTLFRSLFEYLRDINRGINSEDGTKIFSVVSKLDRDFMPRTNKSGVVKVVTNIKNSNGVTVVTGKYNNITDNTAVKNVSKNDKNLEQISFELDKLRREMKKVSDSNDLSKDKAIGYIAAAEEAAKNNNLEQVSSYLKLAGTWALEVAKRIGADLVASYIIPKF